MTTCYYHAKLVLPDEIRPGSVLVEDGTIARVVLDDDAALSADRSIDCEGNYLSPGFIDIHNHGAGGFDFMESEESVYGACRCHMLHGTTTILPTTVTGSREQLLEFVEMFNRVQLEREGCPHIHGLNRLRSHAGFCAPACEAAKYGPSRCRPWICGQPSRSS